VICHFSPTEDFPNLKPFPVSHYGQYDIKVISYLLSFLSSLFNPNVLGFYISGDFVKIRTIKLYDRWLVHLATFHLDVPTPLMESRIVHLSQNVLIRSYVDPLRLTTRRNVQRTCSTMQAVPNTNYMYDMSYRFLSTPLN
jgi:hypothetical protein